MARGHTMRRFPTTGAILSVALSAAVFVADGELSAVSGEGMAGSTNQGPAAGTVADTDPRVAALASPDRKVRWRALVDLFQAKHPRIVIFLIAACKDQDPEMRCGALGMIGDLRPPPRKHTRPSYRHSRTRTRMLDTGLCLR